MKWVSKHTFLLPLIVSGLPLGIYPFVLLANIMAFFAEQPDMPPLEYFFGMTFLLATTFYPIPFFYCAAKSVRLSNDGQDKKALAVSSLSLIYLAFVVGLFFLGLHLSGHS